MLADVAEAGRAEERIGDGVQQRVRVRVAQQTARVRNRHPAQHQRPADHQRVRVPAFADAQCRQVHADTAEPLP